GAIAAAAGSTLNLGGSFSTPNLGSISSAGATVNIVTGGMLSNAGSTLNLNDTTGSWRLAGGTIDGGTVATTGSNALIGTSTTGVLADGITFNGALDLKSVNSARISVVGNLTLGATAPCRSAAPPVPSASLAS